VRNKTKDQSSCQAAGKGYEHAKIIHDHLLSRQRIETAWCRWFVAFDVVI
jgi:hypothetical protein